MVRRKKKKGKRGAESLEFDGWDYGATSRGQRSERREWESRPGASCSYPVKQALIVASQEGEEALV